MVSRALVSVLVYLNGLFAIGLFKRKIKRVQKRGRTYEKYRNFTLIFHRGHLLKR